MPLNRCKGGLGYRWGQNGTCYTGPNAKKKALAQGMAITGGKLEKAKDDATVSVEIPITIHKNDPDRQLLFGYANVSMAGGQLVVDSHGDTIELAELENAAYEFNLTYHNAAVGEMHKGDAKGKLVESFVATPEKLEKMGLTSKDNVFGWWVGFHIEDETLWKSFRSGELTALSIQGSARRIKDE